MWVGGLLVGLDHPELFPVHALDVAGDVHLLLGAVVAVGALELGVLAALPFLVVAEGALELVVAAALGALDPLGALHFLGVAPRRGVGHHAAQEARHRRMRR